MAAEAPPGAAVGFAPLGDRDLDDRAVGGHIPGVLTLEEGIADRIRRTPAQTDGEHGSEHDSDRTTNGTKAWVSRHIRTVRRSPMRPPNHATALSKSLAASDASPELVDV